MPPRTEGFRIGCVHGLVQTHERSIEAQLRNDIFLIGMLRIEETLTSHHDIRLMAYEMPLETGATRGRCVDLFGYDKDKRPWIIELKKPDSSEKINEKVVPQLNSYAEMFDAVKAGVEQEIRNKFFWEDFSFVGEPRKMILADRTFFSGNRKTMDAAKHSGIYCCSFSRLRNVMSTSTADAQARVAILARNVGKGVLRLSIQNR